MKKLLLGVVMAGVVSSATAGSSEKLASGVYAEIQTSLGKIVCRLFPDKVPKTVENFVGLAEGTKEFTDPKTNTKAKRPYFDGIIFHRVIEGFMIQTGDPLGMGYGGPGYKFADEIRQDLGYEKPGVLAMANSGPNTNGSQFFITVADLTRMLAKNYTIFGQVVSGQEVADAISKVRRDQSDKPLEPVVMKSVKIIRVK